MRYNLYIVGGQFVNISEWVYIKSGKGRLYKSTKTGSPYSYDPIYKLKDGILNCQRYIVKGGENVSKAGYEYYLVPETHSLFNINQLWDIDNNLAASVIINYIVDEFYNLNPGSIELKN